MADRQIVYPGAIPLDTDILCIQRNMIVALGFLAQATLGTTTVVDGLTLSATGPASMTVNVGPGSILALSTVDATAFGSLNSDTSALVKMGVNLTSTAFTLTAPVTAGQSVNYLIEATFAETDTNAVVLPYYNAANPAVAYSGPNNTGATQNTQRVQRVSLQLKAGTPATTGTQTTPATDSGWVALYAIVVNYGQTSITSTQVTSVIGASLAPFINTKLPQQTPGFSHQQAFYTSGTFTVPNGITRARVRLWAGGAGGGYAQGSNAGGSGGGGGGYAEGIITVTPGASIAVTVGAGGAGGTSSGSPNGGAGGTSSFGAFISAAGGGSGLGGNATTAVTGGSGGLATGATVTTNGGNGSLPTPVSTGIKGGSGGSSCYGGVVEGQINAVGLAGANIGVGGSGAGTASGSGSTFAGGAGVQGCVIVEW